MGGATVQAWRKGGGTGITKTIDRVRWVILNVFNTFASSANMRI